MKKFYTFVSIFIFTLLANYSNGQVICKTNDVKENNYEDRTNTFSFQTGYYIIAGAFTIRENAAAFFTYLKKKGYAPTIISSNSNHKNYVTLDYSTSVNELRKKLEPLRKMGEVKDAWILKISNNNEIKDPKKDLLESSRQSESVLDNRIKNTRNKNLLKTHSQYKLIINVHDENNVKIPATVAVINGEKAKVISTIPSNELISFRYPKAENQTIKLSCENFGFHKATFDLNLANPVNEKTLRTVKKSGDTIIVDMKLEKPHKGDIMVMYNVFFFPNSNAIRQKSNYELQQLLSLFGENPELKIKIHGHTNGSLLGKFVKIKKNSDDLFSTCDHTMKFGTSGTLSRLRSSTIKRFLTSNGVDKNRIKIKGWGGRRMIHKEHSPLAEYNIRVEIEILAN